MVMLNSQQKKKEKKKDGNLPLVVTNGPVLLATADLAVATKTEE